MAFFIGTTPLNNRIYVPLIGGTPFPDCDFTTYFDGSSEVLKEFVKRAPLNLINDSLDNSNIALVDLDTDWDIELKVNIDPSASVADRIIRMEKTAGSANFTLDIATTTIRLFISDASNILQANLNRAYTQGTDAVVKITRVGSAVTLDVNGSVTTDPTVDLTTNGCAIDELTIGAEDPDFREIPGLFFYCNISNIDSWNFVSNVDDGLVYTGLVNGMHLALKDDSPFDAQFPNYTPSNPDDIFPQPQTGPTQFRNDNAVWEDVANTDNLSNIGLDEWIEVTPVSPVGENDSVMTIHDSTGTQMMNLFYQESVNRFRVAINPTSNGAVNINTANESAPVDNRYFVHVFSDITQAKATRDTTIEVYDDTFILVATAALTLDWTTDWLATKSIMGARLPNSSESNVNIFTQTSNVTGVTHWDTRLWTEFDPNGGTVISTTDKEFIIDDDSPFGMMYPYIGEYNTAYLVSDTLCEGTDIVTIGGIAQIRNGVWQVLV